MTEITTDHIGQLIEVKKLEDQEWSVAELVSFYACKEDGYVYFVAKKGDNFNAYLQARLINKKITKEHIGKLARIKNDSRIYTLFSCSNDSCVLGCTDGIWETQICCRNEDVYLLEIKPVNENCLFKEILVSDFLPDEKWKRRILLGIDHHHDYAYSVGTPKEPKTIDQHGVHYINTYTYAERCPDVIYGDENEN